MPYISLQWHGCPSLCARNPDPEKNPRLYLGALHSDITQPGASLEFALLLIRVFIYLSDYSQQASPRGQAQRRKEKQIQVRRLEFYTLIILTNFESKQSLFACLFGGF